MPSAERRPSRPSRSLVSRVGLLTAATAGIAAVVATLAAMAVADRLIVAHLERTADETALGLAGEIAEEPTASHVKEETDEVAARGMRVAVWRGRTRVAGNADLTVPREERCAPVTRGEVCRRDAGTTGLTVVVAVPTDLVESHGAPFAVAGISVLAVVLLGAGLAGRVVARRSLAPLSTLAGAAARADLGAPPHAWLPPRTGLSEIDALHDALDELVARLGAEVERAERFASSAAHELRTPLAKLGARLELLSEGDLAADARADVTAAHRTVVSLTTLTERLLMLAKPDATLATSEGASVAQLMEDLCRELDPERAGRVALAIAGDTDAVVRGDPVLLRAMLDNAVDNALTHTTGRVTIHVEEQPGRIVVDVDDEGPGVPPGQREALFEAFARMPDARPRPGHGLGLPLIRHIAAVHGGSAELGDGPTGGRLRITLPPGKPACPTNRA